MSKKVYIVTENTRETDHFICDNKLDRDKIKIVTHERDFLGCCDILVFIHDLTFNSRLSHIISHYQRMDRIKLIGSIQFINLTKKEDD